MLSRLFNRKPVIPVVRLQGAIGAVSPLRSGLSLATTEQLIERAFKQKGAPAIAIQVNSPGGSPVQSMLIFKRIRALADEKELPVYVFAEDAAASGGYILALAGDEIYADASSIVGSIGVVSAGFGLDKFIEKHDIDRRVYTAGTKKFALDPFKPEDPSDVDKVKAIQKDMHTTFIDLVKSRRGAKIDQRDETLFSGEFWTGNQALHLGLIDGISDMKTKMREKFGEDIKFKAISKPKGFLSRLGPFSSERMQLPYANYSLAEDIMTTAQTRTLWARLGL